METLLDIIQAPWFPAALAVYSVILVVYYILIARSILQMLRVKANAVSAEVRLLGPHTCTYSCNYGGRGHDHMEHTQQGACYGLLAETAR